MAFNKNISLKVAKILKVEENPESDKLYVETLDDGSGTERVIQSGLRAYLKKEELLGKHIILAANLAPRKMRGIESRGMLLAADWKDADGKDRVEVLEAPWAEPGTEVVLEGSTACEKPAEISGDDFFKVSINVKDGNVCIADKELLTASKEIKTVFAKNGPVN